MDRTQIAIIALVGLLATNFTLPLLFNEFELGFDLPLVGHVTLWNFDGFGEWGFLLGGIFVIVIVYLLMKNRRNNK